MNGNLAVIPALLSLFGAVGLLILPRKQQVQTGSASGLLLVQLLLSFFLIFKTSDGTILTTFLGGWSPPFGITVVVDLFSAIMLTSANAVFLIATIFYLIERGSKGSSLTLPLIFFMQAGLALALFAGDIFNLFVGFEIMLVSSYAIIEAEAEEKQARHVYHYLIISITTSALLLATVAMIYGYTGQLNMAALSRKFETMQDDPKLAAIAIFALLVFGVKAGMFPFYFWLPSSYASLPGSLAGLFSGTLTKASLCVMVRLFVTVFPHNMQFIYETLLVLAGFTMFLGVLGAIANSSMKGILCYHILSQLGYVFMALGMFSALSVSAGIFFTVHNMIVKSSLLLIAGVVVLHYKTDQLKSLSGVATVLPLASLFFMLQALSLAGIPPFSGFWGKYLIYLEGLKGQHYVLVFLAALTSFLTLFSMIKIWTGAFTGPRKKKKPELPFAYNQSMGAIGVLVAFALVMGLGAETGLALTKNAAEQLFDKSAYINAVLGEEAG